MHKDEIVEEVREIRRAHAEAHGFDLRRIYEDLKQKEKRSGRAVVNFEPRPARLARKTAARGRAQRLHP